MEVIYWFSLVSLLRQSDIQKKKKTLTYHTYFYCLDTFKALMATVRYAPWQANWYQYKDEITDWPQHEYPLPGTPKTRWAWKGRAWWVVQFFNDTRGVLTESAHVLSNPIAILTMSLSGPFGGGGVSRFASSYRMEGNQMMIRITAMITRSILAWTDSSTYHTHYGIPVVDPIPPVAYAPCLPRF